MSAEAIGTDEEQLARLIHAEERHGLALVLCEACDGTDERCGSCDGAGITVNPGNLTPCGPRAV